MKKFLILFLAAIVLFSGCVDQRTVKSGDNISVNYIGSIKDGEIFDTSIEDVAKQNNIHTPGRQYKPLQFTVGKGEVISGFDDGVIGMKVGDTKTLEIPPEKAYGPINPEAIQVIPIIEEIPVTRTFAKVLELPVGQFERIFGPNHAIGDNVSIPETNINLTVQNISSNVSLSYDLTVGSSIVQSGAPWNETVVKIDDKNITTRADVNKGDIIQLEEAPWNTTVIDVTDMNVTLRHNAIPDTELQTMFGPIRIHFNETSITIDQNSELAGKTLVFEVTLISID